MTLVELHLDKNDPLLQLYLSVWLQFRHMTYTNRTRTSMDDGEFNINPEPVPYQPQNFM